MVKKVLQSPDGIVAAVFVEPDVLSVSRSLTSGEILALTSTPIDLLAGVAGKAFAPVTAAVRYNFGTVAYESLDFGYLSIGWNVVGVDVAISHNSETVFIAQAVDRFFVLPAVSPAGGDLDDINGTPLVVWISATAANPTDGDGTLDITVLYREVDVA